VTPYRFRTFTLKEDIEIAGFLSATIAWGNRKMIIKNAHKMIDLMGSPYDYIMSHTDKNLEQLESFVHRTLTDKILLILSSRLSIYFLNQRA
jgi:hypothetical protein